MKRFLSIFLTVILLCGVTVSCSNGNDEPEEENTETLIMFFPYSRLEGNIAENIRAMRRAVHNRKGLGDTRLIVYKATSYANGQLYEITYKDGSLVENTISDFSATFSSSNQMANIDKIRTVLNKVKEYAPSKTYSMIIGCHGNSWIQAGNCLDYMNRNYAKGMKAFGTAEDANQIDNKSLVEALQQCNIHLTYLLFDACYMGSIEAAYDFRNVCDYYLSSQNEILTVGVPYDKVGDDLLKHNYDAVVNKYYEFYSKYIENGMYASFGSFSVVRTSYLEDMAKIVREINISSLSETASIGDVQREDGIKPTIFFDFKDYYEKFCTDAAAMRKFNATLKLLVPFERHTDEYFTGFDNVYHQPATNSCGINTSQPTQNPAARKLVIETEWWAATH